MVSLGSLWSNGLMGFVNVSPRPLHRYTRIAADFIYSISIFTRGWIRGNRLADFGMAVDRYVSLPLKLFMISHFSSNRSLQCLRTINYYYYRLREPPHSESGITSRTQLVAGAERFLSTSKRRLARRVATHRRRWDSTTGDRKLRVAAQKVPVAWDTWRQWPANSRMDSEKAHKPRSKPHRLMIRYDWFDNPHKYFFRCINGLTRRISFVCKCSFLVCMQVFLCTTMISVTVWY